jgi:hypothetical protein
VLRIAVFLTAPIETINVVSSFYRLSKQQNEGKGDRKDCKRVLVSCCPTSNFASSRNCSAAAGCII